MSQPVASYLTNAGSDTPLMESVGIWDRPQRQNRNLYHYTLEADSYIVKPGKDVAFLSTARKLCKTIICGTDYPHLIKSLDSFVTDVIETSSHLSKLEVSLTLFIRDCSSYITVTKTVPYNYKH